LRYLGPASLIEDGSVRSPSSTLLNVEIGRRFGERWKLMAGVYNALDRAANDITYFYESRLPGENAAVQDLHFHPVEPRTLRVTLEARR
jgi:outer membrane receptor protein involved in Fe transport